MPGQPLSFASIAIEAPLAREPVGRAGGLALFAALLTERAFAPTVAANDQFGKWGATIEAKTYWGGIGLELIVPQDNLAHVLESFVNLVAVNEPAAWPDDLQDRQVAKLGYLISQPAMRVRTELPASIFHPHRVGLPLLGTSASISAISASDMLDTAQQLAAAPTTLVVAGGEPDEATTASLAARVMTYRSVETLVAPTACTGRQLVVVDAPAIRHIQFALGAAGPAAGSSDWTALLVVAELLGHGMVGLLNEELRARRGITYGVDAALDNRFPTSIFRVYGAAGIADVPTAVGEILRIIARLLDTLTEDVVRQVHHRLGVARALARQSAPDHGGEATLAALNMAPAGDPPPPALADVREAVDRYLSPHQWHLVAMGPADELSCLADHGWPLSSVAPTSP